VVSQAENCFQHFLLDKQTPYWDILYTVMCNGLRGIPLGILFVTHSKIYFEDRGHGQTWIDMENVFVINPARKIFRFLAVVSVKWTESNRSASDSPGLAYSRQRLFAS